MNAHQEFIPAQRTADTATPLMYGPRDTLLTIEQLRNVRTPPAMGARHRPVGFGEYTDLVRHRMAAAGIDVAREEYCITNDGNSFFGCMVVNVDGFSRDDSQLIVGLRGSHNQRLPRGLTIGNRVMVCSNLCFSGDLGTFKTKQTSNVWHRLPLLVQNAIENLPQVARAESHRIDAYRQCDLRPRWGDAALVELFRRRALTAAQLGTAATEWHEPSHEEHAADGHTAWRLLNAVTEAQKPKGNNANMDTVRSRTGVAVDFLDGLVGVAA